MKKTIWKFQLEVLDTQFIWIPKNAEILSVQNQNEVPCMWALVNPTEEREEKCFEIFGTGHDVHCDMGVDRKFIGTFQMQNGSLVFHIFERL